MFQVFMIILFLVIGGGYLVNNIIDYNTLLNENAYKQANNIINVQKMINSNFLNYTYMKPSIILLSNNNNIKYSIDKLENAYLTYLKNYKKDNPNCHDLALTNKISEKECEDIINKKYIIANINFNGNITTYNTIAQNTNRYTNDVKYYLSKEQPILKNNKITKINKVDTNIYNGNYFNFMILN